MQIHSKLAGTKGLVSIYDEALRFRDMITQEAEERAKILSFWKKYGGVAAKEAFKVSRPTLFRWQKLLDKGQGKLEFLVPQSTIPKHKRTRFIPKPVEDLILKEREREKIGKEKLAKLLKDDQRGHSLAIHRGPNAWRSEKAGYTIRQIQSLEDAKAIPENEERVVYAVPSYELCKARGGPHCLSMPLLRD